MTIFGSSLQKWAITAAVVYAVAKGQNASTRAREELIDATMKEALETIRRAGKGQARDKAFDAADRMLKAYEKQGAPNVKDWRKRLEEWRVTEGD